MLIPWQNAPARERIIVALDCEKARALELADILAGHARWLKVGMTLFYALGPSIIHDLKERGFNIFLDLKFHDIPHQVFGAAASATRAGADMLTMHTLGGEEMMRAAVQGANKASAEGGSEPPVMLGITVLTSMNQAALSSLNIALPIADQVQAMARLAYTAQAHGVVASPQEASALRVLLGPDAYIVTPGVRPRGSALDDQSRVADPASAIAQGASHLVIGRPITQASDPVAAFEEIVSSLE